MTRILDPAVFHQGQDELIGRLLGAVDVQALKEILAGLPVKLDPILEVQPSGGAMIPLHDRVAIRLDLKVTVPLSITVDAEGNYIPVSPEPAKTDEIASEAAAMAATMTTA